MFALEWENKKRKYYVLFSPAAIEKMKSYRQLAAQDPESGGLMVGHRREPHLEIVDVSEPGPKDKRDRYRFQRRDPKHNRFLERKWKESGHLLDYIGEWHTHPEKHPHPSGLDIGECIRVTLTYPRKPILEVVIGTDSMWVGSYGLVRMESLKPILPESGS